MLNKIVNFVRSEPVAIAGLGSAVLALLLAFGLDLSKDQVAAITAVGSALFALVARTHTTPVKGAK